MDCEKKLKRTRFSWLLTAIILGTLFLLFLTLFLVYLFKYRGAIASAATPALVTVTTPVA